MRNQYFPVLLSLLSCPSTFSILHVPCLSVNFSLPFSLSCILFFLTSLSFCLTLLCLSSCLILSVFLSHYVCLPVSFFCIYLTHLVYLFSCLILLYLFSCLIFSVFRSHSVSLPFLLYWFSCIIMYFFLSHSAAYILLS
jgi:hypothetical protein